MEKTFAVISITNKCMAILVPIFSPVDNRKAPINMVFEFCYPLIWHIISPIKTGIFAIMKIINHCIAAIR